MSSTLDKPRVRDQITDEDWKFGDITTASTQRSTLACWPATVQRFRFPFLHGQLVIECQGSLPKWFQEAIASLDELGELPANWDSYGAKRIRHSSILAAIELLFCVMRDETPAPAVVPTNRGTVMLEWHTQGVDLEVEVIGPGRLHVAFENTGEGTEWEEEIGSNLSHLIECIDRLSKTN
jgi:hypothetical protein